MSSDFALHFGLVTLVVGLGPVCGESTDDVPEGAETLVNGLRFLESARESKWCL